MPRICPDCGAEMKGSGKVCHGCHAIFRDPIQLQGEDVEPTPLEKPAEVGQEPIPVATGADEPERNAEPARAQREEVGVPELGDGNKHTERPPSESADSPEEDDRAQGEVLAGASDSDGPTGAPENGVKATSSDDGAAWKQIRSYEVRYGRWSRLGLVGKGSITVGEEDVTLRGRRRWSILIGLPVSTIVLTALLKYPPIWVLIGGAVLALLGYLVRPVLVVRIRKDLIEHLKRSNRKIRFDVPDGSGVLRKCVLYAGSPVASISLERLLAEGEATASDVVTKVGWHRRLCFSLGVLRMGCAVVLSVATCFGCLRIMKPEILVDRLIREVERGNLDTVKLLLLCLGDVNATIALKCFSAFETDWSGN